MKGDVAGKNWSFEGDLLGRGSSGPCCVENVATGVKRACWLSIWGVDCWFLTKGGYCKGRGLRKVDA